MSCYALESLTAIDVIVNRHARLRTGGEPGDRAPAPGSYPRQSAARRENLKEAGSKTLLSPKETKGKIILQAAPNAPACDKVPIAVMGHVSINFVVKTAYASAPILVSVKPKGK